MRIRGNAIVELVLCLPFILLFVCAARSFMKVNSMRRAVAGVVRVGSVLAGSGLVSKEEVLLSMESAAHDQTGLPSSAWTFTVDRFTETPASKFYRLIVAGAECRTDDDLLRNMGIESPVIRKRAVLEEGR